MGAVIMRHKKRNEELKGKFVVTTKRCKKIKLWLQFNISFIGSYLTDFWHKVTPLSTLFKYAK